MQYNLIPNTNLNVSCIALGTWPFSGDVWGDADEKECMGVICAAGDQGINFIDTAPIYGYGRAESIVGKAIKGKRDQYVIATKCGLVGEGRSIRHDLTPESIKVEVENSLRRLSVEYIDLYQCHWPDPNTPIEKTLDALCKIKDEGKINYIGVSNFDKELLKKASDYTEIVTLQNQYSLLERSVEKEVLPLCRTKNIGMLSYGPLAGGILSGKYKKPPTFAKSDARKFFYKYYSGKSFENAKRLLVLLEEYKKPLNQVAINWNRQQEGVVCVIVGSRNLSQLKQNAQAADWDLTEQEISSISELGV